MGNIENPGFWRHVCEDLAARLSPTQKAAIESNAARLGLSVQSMLAQIVRKGLSRLVSEQKFRRGGDR